MKEKNEENNLFDDKNLEANQEKKFSKSEWKDEQKRLYWRKRKEEWRKMPWYKKAWNIIWWVVTGTGF